MNREQLKAMLTMQTRLNNVINPLWVQSDYPWHRAIMVEAVEALDHHGWKWWKATGEPDVAQIRLELVDIWHFAMSLILTTQNGDIDKTVDVIDKYFSDLGADPDVYGEISTVDTVKLFDLLTGSAGIQRQLNGPAFNVLMQRFGLSWDEMYRTYIAKNILNLFRQDNGYKLGTYIKDWHGKEDNVVLNELMGRNPDATPDELMHLLDGYYQAVKV